MIGASSGTPRMRAACRNGSGKPARRFLVVVNCFHWPLDGMSRGGEPHHRGMDRKGVPAAEREPVKEKESSRYLSCRFFDVRRAASYSWRRRFLVRVDRDAHDRRGGPDVPVRPQRATRSAWDGGSSALACGRACRQGRRGQVDDVERKAVKIGKFNAAFDVDVLDLVLKSLTTSRSAR